jgi:hypothetical protein
MADMSGATKTLYDTDFAEWSDRTAELLRAGRFSELDIENVAEEIASLGRAERKAVRSQLQRLMMHKIKQQLQPERDSKSWRLSIAGARARILDEIEDAPSLKGHLQENMERVYRLAVADALRETDKSGKGLPAKCPWRLDSLLEG